ncbi:MAG: peptidoglycan DD-metalloendopeptidase family protein [Desulfobacterales bacterium]
MQHICGVDRVFYFFKTVSKTIAYTVIGTIIVLNSYQYAGAQSKETGIVSADQLNVRAQPGTENPSLMLIPKGTKVRILEHHNAWLKIMVNGRVGYIRNLRRYVRVIPEEIPKETVKTDNASSDIQKYQEAARSINRKIAKQSSELLQFTRQQAAIISHGYVGAQVDAAPQPGQLSWLGRVYILASAESVYELFQRKKALEQVLAYDENILQNLLDNKNRLQQLMIELKAKKTEKLALETEYNKQIETMSQERKKRSKLLGEIRRKRSLKLAALESLKQAAADLDQTINALRSTFDRTEAREKMPSKSFSTLKGLLNMPVKGKIVSFFGPHRNNKFNVVNFQSGIEIKADRGEPIRAVYDGRVLYADWFKGYGNMVIIDHGNNYYTIYAHAQELFASKGDTVEKGEVVATVGDSGSMIGPSLHFEVRHHGKPVDPMEWIKKG